LIREHVQDPQEVPIVLDFLKASGQTTKPIFRFLIDHAAMFAMKNRNEQSYFVLDKFAQIPNLRRFEELVNVGRGEKVTTLVTLQSVQQLYSNYGHETGEAILSELVSMILLRQLNGHCFKHPHTD
jgi:type IV secretory pathway TraG/TraD family ATPase VirD4